MPSAGNRVSDEFRRIVNEFPRRRQGALSLRMRLILRRYFGVIAGETVELYHHFFK
jgi:hypothetical protein